MCSHRSLFYDTPAMNAYDQCFYVILYTSTELCLRPSWRRTETSIMTKCRDMLLEAAETILSIFGFNRTAYGDAQKKYKKWWQRLNEEKLEDRKRILFSSRSAYSNRSHN
jgi:hypothetical protein